MSMAKRALEDLPEFAEVAEPEPEFAEVAEPEPEFVALTVWRITSDEDLDALLGALGPYDEEGVDCIIECDYGFPSIEDDYDWIRRGC